MVDAFYKSDLTFLNLGKNKSEAPPPLFNVTVKWIVYEFPV